MKFETGYTVIYSNGSNKIIRFVNPFDYVVFTDCSGAYLQTLENACKNGSIIKVISNTGCCIFEYKSFPKLKSGMRVKTKNNTIFLVVYSANNYYLVHSGGSVIDYSDYCNNLHPNNPDMNIIEIYESFTGSEHSIFNLAYLKPIWTAPKIVELTLEDIAKKFEIPVNLIKIKN